MVKQIPLLLLAVGLSGCVLGPDHVRPETDLPSGWVAAGSVPASQAAIGVDPHWWRAFNDATLTGLVEEALQHNADLSLAAARIAEA
ncbi:MAG TPA: RND transporter, partial [Candidatus Macondimonas sp.]|nr:RND transporter [Candidatus Macondimonas sp.]